MTAQVLNKKQHFGQLFWGEVLALSVLERMRKSVAAQNATLSEEQHNEWNTIFSLLDALPTKEMHAGSNRFRKSVVWVGSFSSKSHNSPDIPDDMSEWGWTQLMALVPHLKTMARWAAANELEHARWSPSNPAPHTSLQEMIKKVALWQQRFAIGEYTHRSFDAAAQLAEADGCAVFLPDQQGGGFLDGRGGGGAPLSGARLFESAGAAYTTIGSRGLSNAVVVHVHSSLLHVDPKSTATAAGETLHRALALMDRKRLEEALNMASIEQLRARVQELERLEGGVVEEVSERRKRM